MTAYRLFVTDQAATECRFAALAARRATRTVRAISHRLLSTAHHPSSLFGVWGVRVEKASNLVRPFGCSVDLWESGSQNPSLLEQQHRNAAAAPWSVVNSYWNFQDRHSTTSSLAH